jgi:cytoskeletal protein RodZ
MTVYNTGKVQIGLRYERPKNYTFSRDMERLQDGLLQHKRERRIEAGVYIIGVVVAVALSVVWVMR